MNGKIVYEDTNLSPTDIYAFTGNDYQGFAQPSQLRSIGQEPRDWALLLPNYIRLDRTKELILD